MGVGSINVWGDANRFNTLKRGANCKLLIHSDAVDETHVFTDTIGTHTPAETGNTQHDTAQFLGFLGKSSILFDGAGDYLGVPDHADWNFGTNNLTIDFWVRFSALTGLHTLYYQPGANDDRVWLFVDYGTGRVGLQVVSGSVSLINEYGVWTPLVDVWYHVALIRGWGGVTTTWAICVDGKAVHTFTADVTMPNLNGAVSFGGGLGTTGVYDFSNNAHVISVHGDMVLSTVAKKFGSASLYGATLGADHLELADSSDWEVSTNTNYTIDMWINYTNHDQADDAIALHWEGAADHWNFCHVHGSGLRFFQKKDPDTIIDTGAGGQITDSNWHHVAFCKVGNVYTVYKDGARGATTTDASTDTLTGVLDIGASVGYIDEVRLSVADVFSAGGATITVPTAPSLPDANTKLLIRSDLSDLAGWMTEIRVVNGTAAWTKAFNRPIGKYT